MLNANDYSSRGSDGCHNLISSSTTNEPTKLRRSKDLISKEEPRNMSVRQITHNTTCSGPGCLSGRKGRPDTSQSTTPITASQTVTYPYPCPSWMSQPGPQMMTLQSADVSPRILIKSPTDRRPKHGYKLVPQNRIKCDKILLPLGRARSETRRRDRTPSMWPSTTENKSEAIINKWENDN